MDMLRFHKFTIGWAWVDDYGSSDDPEQFQAIRAYSPAAQHQAGHRLPGRPWSPPPTTTTGSSRPTASSSPPTLQAAQSGDAPILIRIETKAGHGAGKPTSKIIEEAADRWAFLLRALKAE